MTDTTLRVALMRIRRGDKTPDELLEQAEEALPAEAVKLCEVQDIKAVSDMLKSALVKIKYTQSKMPVCFAIPATHAYCAYIEGFTSPPRSNAVSQIASEWIPFPPSQLVLQHEWNGVRRPPSLSIVAVETKLLQSYRMLASRALIANPVCFPRTHALCRLAFGEKGAAQPSILLDMTCEHPVLSLCVGHNVMDERVLFGTTASEAFCETIFMWIPRITAGGATPAQSATSAKEQKALEHKLKKEEKQREKEEKKHKKEEAKNTTMNAAQAHAEKREVERQKETMEGSQMERNMFFNPSAAPPSEEHPVTLSITVFGEEPAKIDAYCTKLKHVTVTPQFFPVKDPAYLFAHAMSAAQSSKAKLPKFT